MSESPTFLSNQRGMVNLRVLLLSIALSIVTTTLVMRHYVNRDLVASFHKLSYYDNQTWSKNRWWNIPTQQNPNDIWIIQEIISETKPDVIVETGTFFGGGSLLWAAVLGQIKPDGKVITIDIEDHTAQARTLPAAGQITFLLGSSTAPNIVDQVKNSLAGKRAMVILDSDHSRNHVLQELRLYSDFVQPGDYLIVQDTNINGHPVFVNDTSGPGPMEAVEQFLSEDDRFVQDRERERLLFTMHPGGYLKRVK